MKSRPLGAVCAFMFVFSHSVAAVTVVNSGETFDFRFDSLTLSSEPVNTSIPVQVDIRFTAGDYFGPLETMTLYFNERAPTGSNFYIGNLAMDQNSGVTHIYEQFYDPHWEDLQGGIKLIMGRGSVEIDEIMISVAVPGQRYRQVFAVGEVPIPPALYLFGSGLLGLVGMARNKSTSLS